MHVPIVVVVVIVVVVAVGGGLGSAPGRAMRAFIRYTGQREEMRRGDERG